MNNSRILKMIFLLVNLALKDIHATNSPQLNQAQNSLQKMKTQIILMKQKLHSQQKTHSDLTQRIAKKNQILEQQQAKKQAIVGQISRLEKQVFILKEQRTQSKNRIARLQKTVFEHLYLRLQLMQKSSWQVVFSAQNPLEYSQRLDLYQYLYQTEQQGLHDLKLEEDKLQQNQENLASKIDTLHQVKNSIERQVLTINIAKNKEKATLNHLQTEMNQHTTALKNIEKNQTKLKYLIEHLLRENRLQANRSFTVMKNKLKYPVDIAHPVISDAQNGIIFHAPLNTKVHAVSHGKVVFADWLNGYGYLLIVDHGWGFMTLYGNNQQLLKHKGENVRIGDEIASIGKSGSFEQTGLYFEIRQKGHVVSALNWFNQKG